MFKRLINWVGSLFGSRAGEVAPVEEKVEVVTPVAPAEPVVAAKKPRGRKPKVAKDPQAARPAKTAKSPKSRAQKS